MSISLTDGITTIELHPDLFWEDEQWFPVEQSTERTITGALVVDVAARVAGRPITLRTQDESSAWMSRSVVDQLRNMAAVPGKTMTLTLRGVDYEVMFRHQDGPLEAAPLVHYNDVDSADNYLCTLRFLEL